MKPINPSQYRRFAWLGLPLLLAATPSSAQDPAVPPQAAEAAERVEKAAEDLAEGAEEAIDKAAEDAAEKAKNAADAAEDATDEAAEDAAEAAEDAADAAEDATDEAAQNAAETAEDAADAAEDATDRMEEEAREVAEDTPGTEVARETPEAEPETRRGRSEPRQNRREGPARERQPEAEPEPEPQVEAEPEPEPQPQAEPEPEPVRQAETQFRERSQEIQRDLEQRATKIRGEDEARELIGEILGAESGISRAEMEREERIRPQIDRRGRDAGPEISPELQQEAVRFFRQRLRGEEVQGPPPRLLGFRDGRRGDGPRGERRGRGPDRFEQSRDFHRPRYLDQGRRYVHFDSRAAIPAILLAAAALDRVQVQPYREAPRAIYERREVSGGRPMALPPEAYRGEDSYVVSYPVDEKSMIASDDILFAQGSTRFADPYSYEIVGALAEAMKELPDEERFVIEGHASAEGSYEMNMALSQQRAERIVREMVRRGVSPYRLLPVGYGESEARYPADARESLRAQDRRVMVFRMGGQPVANR